MLRVEVSTVIRAPCAKVARLYRDYERWPRLFRGTIRGVRLVHREHGRTEIEIDHREGMVPNVMTEVSPNRVDLRESKRHYEACFVNRFDPVPEGTRYTVAAEIRARGMARLLEPLLAGYARRQIVRSVLEPLRCAAEANRPGLVSVTAPVTRSDDPACSRAPGADREATHGDMRTHLPEGTRLAIAYSPEGVDFVASAATRDHLLELVGEYVERSASRRLSPCTAERVRSLHSAGAVGQAIDVYFTRIEEEWDWERLVIVPDDSPRSG